MYKITFGSKDANRGVEFTSRVNKVVIAGLWGHRGTKVIDAGYDDDCNEIYHLTDSQIKINPLLVTCEHVSD